MGSAKAILAEQNRNRPPEVCTHSKVTAAALNFQMEPRVARIPLTQLRANAINGTIYRESLSDGNLGELAGHIARYGQLEPITADASLTILDGERRWRALQLAGSQYANVIIDSRERSSEEVEDYVLDAFSQKRRPSVFEQVCLYEVGLRSYARRFGRPRGRPRKCDTNVSNYWDANRVKDAAARGAGFGSRETARRAQAVIRSDNEDLKRELESDLLKIEPAYQRLVEWRDDARVTETPAARSDLGGSEDPPGRTLKKDAAPETIDGSKGAVAHDKSTDHLDAEERVSKARTGRSRGQLRRGGEQCTVEQDLREDAAPDPAEAVERALSALEVCGDTLLHGDSEESNRDLEHLAARLKVMLERWTAFRGSSTKVRSLREQGNQNDDPERSDDRYSEQEQGDDAEDGVETKSEAILSKATTHPRDVDSDGDEPKDD
jgi:hypothetical protein